MFRHFYYPDFDFNTAMSSWVEVKYPELHKHFFSFSVIDDHQKIHILTPDDDYKLDREIDIFFRECGIREDSVDCVTDEMRFNTITRYIKKNKKLHPIWAL